MLPWDEAEVLLPLLLPHMLQDLSAWPGVLIQPLRWIVCCKLLPQIPELPCFQFWAPHQAEQTCLRCSRGINTPAALASASHNPRNTPDTGCHSQNSGFTSPATLSSSKSFFKNGSSASKVLKALTNDTFVIYPIFKSVSWALVGRPASPNSFFQSAAAAMTKERTHNSTQTGNAPCDKLTSKLVSTTLWEYTFPNQNNIHHRGGKQAQTHSRSHQRAKAHYRGNTAHLHTKMAEQALPRAHHCHLGLNFITTLQAKHTRASSVRAIKATIRL